MHDSTTSTDAALAKLEFSKGWLFRFQERHGLTLRNAHGEAGSVCSVAVDEGRAKLLNLTRDYTKHNVYSMDETVYLYCMSADKSVTKNSIPGRKKIKKRITVTVTSNADGLARSPLFFIGTARRARCFGTKIGNELGLDYASSPKG